MEVTFEGRYCFGQVFADKVGSEAGPGGEMAIIDGFDPCGGDRVPTGSV